MKRRSAGQRSSAAWGTMTSPAPPAHLLLGSDALNLVRDTLQRRLDEIEQWQALTRSTDG